MTPTKLEYGLPVFGLHYDRDQVCHLHWDMFTYVWVTRCGGCTGKSCYQGRVTTHMFGCPHLSSLYKEGTLPRQTGNTGSSWGESQYILPEGMVDLHKHSVQVSIFVLLNNLITVGNVFFRDIRFWEWTKQEHPQKLFSTLDYYYFYT